MSETGKRSKINKQVRAELPAGAAVLDMLNLFQKISLRYPPVDETGKIAALAHDKISEIAEILRIEIQKRNQERHLNRPNPDPQKPVI